MLAKLTTTSELRGLLVRAVAGLRHVMADQRINLPPSVQHATDDYRASADPIRAFIGERVVIAPHTRCARSALWCAWVLKEKTSMTMELPRRGIGSHQSTRPQSHHWITPRGIIDGLGGWQSFDLDPCPSPTAPRPWPTARRFFREDQVDGLEAPWEGRVWCNPPFSREAVKWVEKMAAHNHGILLLAGRLETAWWHEWVPYATAILAPRGRPTFYLPDGSLPKGNSGAPCTLISYGEADARVLETCGLTGALTRWRMVGTGDDDAWQWTHCGLRTAATHIP